jgi:hypothetical protein
MGSVSEMSDKLKVNGPDGNSPMDGIRCMLLYHQEKKVPLVTIAWAPEVWEKDLLLCLKIESRFLNFPARSLIILLSELSWLSLLPYSFYNFGI